MTSAAVPKRVSRQEVTVVSARPNIPARLREIWRYRELLYSLVRKELKVKYKDSALGFAWSLLNPTMRLVVFYFVFTYVVPNGIPLFAIYLLSGLLIWTLFSEGLAAATGSVVGNGAIVKKVTFPREILPLASIGASVVNFFLQIIVLFAALAVFQHAPSLEYSILLIPAMLTVLLLGASIGIFLSAVNVPYRDTGHLLDVVLLLWFWFTPIIYDPMRILEILSERGLEWAYFLNPMVAIIMSFQRAIYNTVTAADTRTGEMRELLPDESVLWYLGHIGGVAAASILVFGLAMYVFGRLEGNFAEEL
jgi:ABC-2 type transport system permease protein